MDRAIIDLPTRYFGMVTTDWHLDMRGRSAGAGVTGDGQTVYGNMPRWVCSLSTRTFHRRSLGQAWRSVIHRVRGRVNVLRVQVNDPLRPWLAETGMTVAEARVVNAGALAHSDGSLFSDGSGYTQTPTAPLLAAASAGATTLSIDGGYLADGLSGGQWFSLGEWLYLATMIEATGTDTVVTIEPPLRASASIGDELDFDPWALMALEDDMQGRMAVDAPFFARATLSLVEWTKR